MHSRSEEFLPRPLNNGASQQQTHRTHAWRYKVGNVEIGQGPSAWEVPMWGIILHHTDRIPHITPGCTWLIWSQGCLLAGSSVALGRVWEEEGKPSRHMACMARLVVCTLLALASSKILLCAAHGEVPHTSACADCCAVLLEDMLSQTLSSSLQPTMLCSLA